MSSSRVPFSIAGFLVGAALTVAAPWIAVAGAQPCQPCPGPCDVPDAADCVCETYGAAVYTHPVTCSVMAFYGKPMSSGTDPGVAAQAWIDNHAGAFDLSPTELQRVRSNLVGVLVGVGATTVFRYQAYIGGVNPGFNKYLGTFTFRASSDANGIFTVDFRIADTLLLDSNMGWITWDSGGSVDIVVQAP